jgi:leukotriene-A4 hydrolase
MSGRRLDRISASVAAVAAASARSAVTAASVLTAMTLLAGCSRSSEAPPSRMDTSTPITSAKSAPPAERDIHSFAVPAEARVTHVALDLRTDFAARQLSGRATLDVQRAPGASRIVLDTRDLDIRAVTDAAGKPLVHALGDVVPILGRPLTVTLPPAAASASAAGDAGGAADKIRIVIDYSTRPNAAALQWLAPEQTAGKKQPYLFSQGQAILTRTWIPTQDSPGIRQTYEARITVPAGLRAVMSAEQLTPDGVTADTGTNGSNSTGSGSTGSNSSRRYDFRLTQPIPPYLIALAVGDLDFRSLGPRTGVYTEPAVLAAAANEFADLEKMVQAAESIGGPYRWGRYDILVLPPSFPFGGMENPRLTFATPTILAGDRSLTSLVAHELAHSWSGNLVTNATWSDFWLNEGFTVFFELRIMEALYGRERASMLEVLGRRELTDEIARLGATSPDTILHIDLKDRDPDDSVGPIAYEKGAALLKTIEAAVGRDKFDVYLRGYFDRHAFTSLTTAQFLADLRQHLLASMPGVEEKLRLDEWIYKPGLPANATQPVSDAFTKVDAVSAAWFKGQPVHEQVATWETQQYQHFLNNLPASMTPAQVEALDKAFGFSKRGNSEILFSWLRVAIRHHYTPAMPALEHFLTTQGRRKFLKPLYEDLMATEWGKAEARRIYQRARPLYHAVATSTLDGIVK